MIEAGTLVGVLGGAWRLWSLGVTMGRLLERMDRLERDVSGLLDRERARER